MRNTIEAVVTDIPIPNSITAKKKFWLSTCGHFINDFYCGFLAPLLPIIVVKLDISLAMAGLLLSIFSISNSLLQPIAGILADRMDRYYFILIGPIITAVFMGFIGWVNQYWMLLFILTLSGIGTAIFHPPAAVLVGKVTNHRKGFLMSIFNMAGALGVTVGSLIIIPLTSTFGLKSTIVTVVLALILFFFSVRPILSEPIVHSNAHVQTNLYNAIKPHLFPLSILFSIVVIRATIVLTFAGFIPLFLTSQNQSTMFGGIALGIYLFFVTAGILLGGHLFDRFGAKKILILSFIFVFPFASGFINLPSVWGLPFLIIFGLFCASSTSVNIILAQEIVPSQANFISAVMIGFGWGVAGLAMVPIAVLAGLIGLYWTLILVSCSSILGLGLVFVFPYHRFKYL